ncbi:MAG: GDP-mannose 4,6-dehydratase [Methanophagales archaeon]|nr:GDP-mannose 4,6-dehydratase [Methanophagales archaeon]
MKALVTGCAGFIGSYLVDKLLEQGYEVIGIDCFTDYYPREIKEANISNALKNSKFKLIEEDILEMDEYPEVDYVFHLAAQAGVRASWGKSFEIYTRNNIEATQKLLEFYKGIKIKKFVYASSSSVYGDVELPMREDSLLKPVSPYGVTKLAADFAEIFHGLWTQTAKGMAVHKFVKAIFNGNEITVFGDGTQTRDFTFVDDAVEANILAAKNNLVGDVFNIGGGSRVSVNDLIEMMEDITGKKAKVKYIEKQKGDVRDTLADVSKAEEEFGWIPKVKIEEGLRKFVNWWEMERLSQY